MKLIISGAIESDGVVGPQVRRASEILRQIIGPTGDLVSANWSLARDASKRAIALVLSDFTGAHVEAKFAPDELANEEQLHARFYKIWGDLLQDRSHQQLNQLSGKIETPGR
ncbi:MAG: hypothetical protein E6K70_25650 [Planctomycetota bacterium]|nr:MAG: hypothetical protein E6K70_25650 [Planctomycetota bacterium]